MCLVRTWYVEEAQEHAELTSHSNFAESTEPVLNLVCSTCGKPCRSKTESDLHTKRTGHTGFVDKTADAAKLITLEVPKAIASPSEDAAEVISQTEEMVIPDVDKNLLQELEGMGLGLLLYIMTLLDAFVGLEGVKKHLCRLRRYVRLQISPLQACLDSGNIENGAYVFNQMENFCSPNLVTCNIMLKGYMDHEMYEEAKELFQKMLEDGYSSSKSGYELEYMFVVC